jgi:hypothetical protein
LPEIFNLFAQADATPGRAQGGLGIGLTLVRSFVEMHRGTVSGSSEGVGRGSTFVVRLPLLTDAEARQTAADDGRDAGGGHRRRGAKDSGGRRRRGRGREPLLVAARLGA